MLAFGGRNRPSTLPSDHLTDRLSVFIRDYKDRLLGQPLQFAPTQPGRYPRFRPEVATRRLAPGLGTRFGPVSFAASSPSD